MKQLIALLFFLSCLTIPLFCSADEGRLTPEPARISDEAIASDIRTINRLQKRLADVNTQGTPIGTYHFAKSQAWIDMAMDEYTMNDRTPVVEDALRQASDLIDQLEQKKADISMTTIILPTSKKIRPDLWQKAVAWKKHPGFSCGEDVVAQLEVQLVWAGHEDNQLGWRHAKPYLQAAERLAREAGRKIEECKEKPAAPDSAAVEAEEEEESPVTPAPVCPTCSACPAQAPPAQTDGNLKTVVSSVQPSSREVPDRVHFGLNRYTLSSRSAAILERVAQVLKSDPELTLELRGYADERGREMFNRILSKQRAEVVRTYLVAAGIPRERLSVKAFGKTAPFVRGRDIVSYARNRRVEFMFSSGGEVRPFRQFEDVQVEGR